MTNEDMCRYIAQGDSDELIPLLWEKVKKLFYMKAEGLYIKHSERAVKCGVEFADVRQECYIAFLAALNDYTKAPQTVKFATFAGYHVLNTVNSLLGLRTQRKRRELLNNATSLDTPISEDDSLTVADTIEDETSMQPYEDVDHADIHRVIRQAVDELPEVHRTVIQERYYNDSTFKQTAAMLNMTDSRARQLETEALCKLRRMKSILAVGRDLYSGTGYSAFKRHQASSVERYAEMKIEIEESIVRLKEYQQLRKDGRLFTDEEYRYYLGL